MQMFSRRLKELRTRKKMSQEELSIKLSIPRATIAGYESGSRSLPREPRLKKISNFFGVSIDYLLGHKDSETDSVNFEDQIVALIKSSTIHYDYQYTYTEEEKNKIIQILLSIASMDKEERNITLEMLNRITKKGS
ncbi:hypothetical protein PAECIP111893_01565 [Paenibacillus plantiphilus]|uniref:HTH cro/C1-type domain-containing protein n=1 Tax=Paenibacillus plantiphilus TaxID=2905650 RepID=A0ABM9C410_9BACL|nr:helix-turn-helix transcriptional regulator [Paenibacillus plantiphilus]CAH1200781.1 hypothetical protein PAECIP111893_01565 [Paenibacillus plantiphilus]